MGPRASCFVVLVGAILGCRSATTPVGLHGLDAATATATDLADAAALGSSDAGAALGPTPIDFDGNDDVDLASEGPATGLAASYRLVKLGRPPLALRRICDLRAHAGKLYAAHANDPLNTDGATITTFTPDAEKPFAVAFDWNRPGEPTRGGGAGQGFLRVHRILTGSEPRLYVTDADPPHDGFHTVDQGTEGYVFVSDPIGRFAPARAPHYRLPIGMDIVGDAGVAVVPRAYHVIDAVKFRGHVYASTGSVPPGERAWHGPAPGALHVLGADNRFAYDVGFPIPYRDGVWRLTFLVRFRDRLYAGIQDYDRKSPWDYVMYAPDRATTRITESDAKPVRVTDDGAANTLRWFADRGRLYWIAFGTDGVKLRVTTDGDTWSTIELPEDAGRPTDIRRFRDALVVQTERALLALAADGRVTALGSLEKSGNDAGTAKKKVRSPFAFDDIFCTAPLGVIAGRLFVGAQTDGSLYEWQPE